MKKSSKILIAVAGVSLFAVAWFQVTSSHFVVENIASVGSNQLSGSGLPQQASSRIASSPFGSCPSPDGCVVGSDDNKDITLPLRATIDKYLVLIAKGHLDVLPELTGVLKECVREDIQNRMVSKLTGTLLTGTEETCSSDEAQKFIVEIDQALNGLGSVNTKDSDLLTARLDWLVRKAGVDDVMKSGFIGHIVNKSDGIEVTYADAKKTSEFWKQAMAFAVKYRSLSPNFEQVASALELQISLSSASP